MNEMNRIRQAGTDPVNSARKRLLEICDELFELIYIDKQSCDIEIESEIYEYSLYSVLDAKLSSNLNEYSGPIDGVIFNHIKNLHDLSNKIAKEEDLGFNVEVIRHSVNKCGNSLVVYKTKGLPEDASEEAKTYDSNIRKLVKVELFRISKL